MQIRYDEIQDMVTDMYYEEYGNRNNKTIVFLHGAYFVQSFGRQYSLAEKYHLIVPHITGFGKETDTVFTTDRAVDDIAEIIRSLDRKVTLVGFSIGAQVAIAVAQKYPQLISGAVVVSPWLIKNEQFLAKILKANLKQYKSLKRKWFCSFVGAVNGLPKEKRKEFVEQTMRVKEETIRNIVDNGITLETARGITLPMIALAGGKEQTEVTDSVKKLTEMNPECRYEIWEKAAHNIPPLFYKRFNDLLEAFIEETGTL